MPGHPWTKADLHSVLAAQARIADGLTLPSPLLMGAVNERSFAERCRRFLNIWGEVRAGVIPLPADAPAWAASHLDELADLEGLVPAATENATGIMHFDLRADNVMIVDDRAVVLDWNWARPGPAAADTVMLLQTAFGQHDIDALLRAHPTTSTVGTNMVDGILAALGGFMIVADGRKRLTVRAVRRLQAGGWLRRRRPRRAHQTVHRAPPSAAVTAVGSIRS